MNEFDMGLEDLKEDLEGSTWQFDEETGESVLLDDNGEFAEDPAANPDRSEELTTLMGLESLLVKDGMVSRSVASRFEQYLPSDTPLYSFTEQPTRVNHGMALEVLGSAIRMVAAAGVIALVGGVGMLLFKMAKRKKLMPKNDLDKKMTAAFSSIEEKLKLALQELQSLLPDIKHPAMNWSRQDATISVAANKGVNECAAMILSGKYPFLPDRLYGHAADQAKQVCDFIEHNMLNQIGELVKRGTEDDITRLDQALGQFKVTDNAHPELVAYCKSLGLEVGEDQSPAVVWQERFSKALDREAIKSALSHVEPNHKPMGDVGVRRLVVVQERIVKLHSQLDKAIKQLEGQEGSVSGNYATKLKELVQKVKAPLSSLSDTFLISDAEVKAFNDCVVIKGNVVGDGFNFLKNQYTDLAQKDRENAPRYKEAIAHLTKLFATIKDAIK